MKIKKASSEYQKIIELLCEISTREKMILEMRYIQEKTQKEVAKTLHITPERVRQIENRMYHLINKRFDEINR